MGIKKVREIAGLTQIQLAEAVGISQSAIALWEAGRTMPRADKLSQLAKVLNCTVDELLNVED